MNDWLVELGSVLAGAVLLMLVLWFVQRRTGNAGIVDVGWAFGIGAAVAALALVAEGEMTRRLLIVAITGVWGVRLGWHLAQRMRREPEDGRYQALRTWAGERQQLALFTFYMIQASWVLLFSVPQYVALQNDAPLQVWDLLAMLIVAVSLIGEAIADRQLAQFKQDPASRGRTCRRGLWRYSRHPNYFFEWLHWFAYPLLAVGMGWYILIPLAGPIMMFVFLVKVTGIPPTEARALETRGADYRRYQQTTSAFFPWFPKEEPA